MLLNRFTLGLGIVANLICVYFFGGGQIGFSYEQNDQKIIVACGTHPVLLGWAAVGIGVFYALIHRNYHLQTAGTPSLRRRFVAFVIDFYFALFISGSIEAILPLIVEARRTGHFAWHFVRRFSVPSDAMFALLALLSIILLAIYFIYPMTRGKQTVGCYLMRIVVRRRGAENASFSWRQGLMRLRYEAMGFGFWPYTLWKGIDNSGQTWYDRQSRCDARLVACEREANSLAEASPRTSRP